MAELTIRPATGDDVQITADLMFGSDDQVGSVVSVRIFGARDHEQLRPLLGHAWRAAQSWRSTWVAVEDTGDVVGMVMIGEPRLALDARLVSVAVRSLGWRAVRLPQRLRIASRVSTTKPAGSLVVGEIHVRPDRRGGGLGARLLARADVIARDSGHASLSLDTYATNPARHLYERAGYVVAGSSSDAAFERLTGVAGRVLYVKTLPPVEKSDDTTRLA